MNPLTTKNPAMIPISSEVHDADNKTPITAEAPADYIIMDSNVPTTTPLYADIPKMTSIYS